ncbi:hypothetical protein VNI00_011840 [Paramarasmius palmivorus]|uniref:Uncharacterized protein n=1 Tax=Paramarasmius palmivorus TaxID=297713 RepID=A0AAW0C8P0_9AGAR
MSEQPDPIVTNARGAMFESGTVSVVFCNRAWCSPLHLVADRVTRSQKVFSPFTLHANILHVPTDFDAEVALAGLERLRLVREKEGRDEFDEEEGVMGQDQQPEAEGCSRDVFQQDEGLPPVNSDNLGCGSNPSHLKRPRDDSRELPEAYKCAKLDPEAHDARVALSAQPRHRKAEKRARQKQRDYEQRRVVREVERAASGVPFKKVAKKKGAKSAAENKVPIALGTEKLRVVDSGWTGVRLGRKCRKTYTLDEAKKAGMTEFLWDGKETHLLVTQKDVCVGILGAAQTDDASFREQLQVATAALDNASKTIHFTAKEKNNDRGTSPACARGVSHGGGQKEPKVLSHSAATEEVLEQLIELPLFNRLSGRANHFLEFYAPRAFAFQRNGLQKLLEHHKQLKLNFVNTAFAACTWNFGPRFVSYPHLDANNSPFTWCAITAMGTFKPDHGGHLILPDLGLIIRFPPGATILIPSALLVHSNTLIGKDETRYSFVQYSSGALFRWVDHGFQTAEAWLAQADKGMVAHRATENAARVANGLRMFSTTQELQAMYASLP